MIEPRNIQCLSDGNFPDGAWWPKTSPYMSLALLILIPHKSATIEGLPPCLVRRSAKYNWDAPFKFSENKAMCGNPSKNGENPAIVKHGVI